MGTQHEWTKAPGYKTWTCACGAKKQTRKFRVGSWHAQASYDADFYATPEQQARGVWTKERAPACARAKACVCGHGKEDHGGNTSRGLCGPCYVASDHGSNPYCSRYRLVMGGAR